MRRQFVKTVEDLMAVDERIVLLLGDIGVYGFRNAFDRFPTRTYNVGICEQAMTSLAAGMAKEDLIPVLHSIAPFVVERSFEQLKIDFGYQRLAANIVSVGSSYDYASLGCTHHCPGDVALLRNIPGMQIAVPGSPSEFDVLFRKSYASDSPTYFRLSERSHGYQTQVRFGQAEVIQKGSSATIIAVGPVLSVVMAAVEGLDASVLYYTTLAPFDGDALRANCSSGAVLVVEPFYEGSIAADIIQAMNGRKFRMTSVGVPRSFLTRYGRAELHDEQWGLTKAGLRARIERFLAYDV
jgi:transketolase